MKVDKLLSSLDKVKRTGEGKWMAPCPAHNDRSPSLSIKETEDGKILLHCFAGCSVHEVVESMGLTLADLMPDNPRYRKGSKPPRFNKFELFDRVVFESTILLVAIRQLFNGTPLTDDDMERVKKAESTIDDITRECIR